MSTRSITGILHTESDEIGSGVYCHWDGYPSARLPALKAMIVRDGVQKVIETILEANTGGWSILDSEYQEEERGSFGLGDRGESVPGYGLKYADTEPGPSIKHSEAVKNFSIEYIYYLDPVTGDIVWFEQGDSTEHRELFSEFGATTQEAEA